VYVSIRYDNCDSALKFVFVANNFVYNVDAKRTLMIIWFHAIRAKCEHTVRRYHRTAWYLYSVRDLWLEQLKYGICVNLSGSTLTNDWSVIVDCWYIFITDTLSNNKFS